MEQRLLNLSQAATYLGFKDGRPVHALAERGEITRVYIGKNPRFEKADLDDYIDSLTDKSA